MLTTLLGEYKGVFHFFKVYKKFWIILTAVSVAAFLILSVLFWGLFCDDSDVVISALDHVNELFEDKSDIITDEAGNISAIGLFKNNIIAMFLICIIGFFPFVFAPVFALLLNIFIISVTVSAGIAIGAFDAFGAFILIAPHGIFEIPALLISSGLGIMVCHYVSSRIVRYDQEPSVAANLLTLEIARTLILVVFPLLTAACVSEAYLTPAIFSVLM